MKRIKKTNVIHKKRKLWLLMITAVAFLLLWSHSTEKQARIVPDYAKVSMETYIQKDVFTKKDYKVILEQTGLAPLAVDELQKRGDMTELWILQENFFREIPVQCKANTIISREEKNTTGTLAYIPIIEEGDILITCNSHVFGWRNGHAAIVVDAAKRLTLEARTLGSNSAIMSMKHWERYPSFVILRLKDAAKQERTEIAEFAKQNLVDIPYQLTAGWWKTKETTGITGTHCAHLVWYAYQQFGYNLDSDGGGIVTPNDLFHSPLLETVQIYGMDVYSR